MELKIAVKIVKIVKIKRKTRQYIFQTELVCEHRHTAAPGQLRQPRPHSGGVPAIECRGSVWA